MLAGNINHGAGLNVNGLGIGLILNLRTGFQFRSGKYAEALKQLHGFRFCQYRDSIHHRLNIRKSPALRFLHPFLRVAVAVEYNPLMLRSILFNQIMDRHIKVLRLLQAVTGFGKCLSRYGIEHHVRRRYGIPGTHHTKLKLIARKGKGRSTVPIRSILGKVGKCLNPCVQMTSPQTVSSLTGAD